MKRNKPTDPKQRRISKAELEALVEKFSTSTWAAARFYKNPPGECGSKLQIINLKNLFIHAGVPWPAKWSKRGRPRLIEVV